MKIIIKQISIWMLILMSGVTISACDLLVKHEEKQLSAITNLKAAHDMGCDGLLDYYEIISDMPEEMRSQELNDLRIKSKLNGTKQDKDCHGLQLVLLLMQPGANLHDYEEACLILESLNYDAMSSKYKQFTFLLSTHVKQNKILLDKQYELETQLAKERAVSIKLSKKLSELESQLDQLKDIEKNINEKEQTITVPSIDSIPHDSEKDSPRR